MEGFLRFEPISGMPGWPETRSSLKFRMGDRSVQMIENITVRNLSCEFTGADEMKGLVNIMKNKFARVNDTTTWYISEQEFRFKGMMRFIALLMLGAFRKQSMKYLESFKNFVERS
ncbi:MAG: SRPBCC family protein [Bacteroidia bacterium]